MLYDVTSSYLEGAPIDNLGHRSQKGRVSRKGKQAVPVGELRMSAEEFDRIIGKALQAKPDVPCKKNRSVRRALSPRKRRRLKWLPFLFIGTPLFAGCKSIGVNAALAKAEKGCTREGSQRGEAKLMIGNQPLRILRLWRSLIS